MTGVMNSHAKVDNEHEILGLEVVNEPNDERV